MESILMFIKNYKKPIVVVSVIFIVLVIVGLVLLGSTQTIKLVSQNIYLKEPLATAQLNQDDVVFANGRAIVKYSPGTGKSINLTNTTTIPSLSNILPSPDGRYILFQTIDASFNDDLGQKLISSNRKPSEPWWWLLNTQTKEISLINNSLRTPQWSIDSKTFYAIGTSFEEPENDITTGLPAARSEYIAESGSLVVFDVQNIQKKPQAIFLKGKGIRDFYNFSRSKFVVRTSENELIEMNEKGVETKEINNNTQSAIFSSSGQYYITSKPNKVGSRESVQQQVAETNTGEVVAEFSIAEETNAVWSSAGDTLFFTETEGNKITMFDVKNSKKNFYEVGEDKKLVFNPIFAYSKDLLLVSRIGGGTKLVRVPSSGNLVENGVLNGLSKITDKSLEITYVGNLNYVSVQGFGVSKNEAYSAAESAILSKKVDPNITTILLDIRDNVPYMPN